MAYVKHNFTNGQVLNATPLNEIDNGIASNETTATSALSQASQANTTANQTANSLVNHTSNKNNPHQVTATQVGLVSDQIRHILVGTSEPTQGQGSNGDLYVLYSV